MAAPVEIFCCYSRKDQQFLNDLKAHLMPLERQGLITIWVDTNIDPGMEWEREINHHLRSAQIILLLVSPAFMSSDYCYGKEMKQAMERHERGEARVIPIILRQAYWQKSPFGKLQALPKDGIPVTNWSNPDEAFFSIVEGIYKVAEQLTKRHDRQLIEAQQETDRIQIEIQRQLELQQKKAEQLEAELLTTQQRIKEFQWLLYQYRQLHTDIESVPRQTRNEFEN